MDQRAVTATVSIIMPDGSIISASVPAGGTGAPETVQLMAHHALTAAARIAHDSIGVWTRSLPEVDPRPQYQSHALIDPSAAHGSDGYVDSGPIPSPVQWTSQEKTTALPRRMPAS